MSCQTFYSIISPTLAMRKEPDGKSEVVSEGLFSESVHVLEEKGKWANIKTLLDDYTGWVRKEGICTTELPYAPSDVVKVTTSWLAAHLYGCPDTVYGPILTLPFESRLEIIDFKEDGSRWLEVLLPDARRVFIQRGDVTVDEGRMPLEQLEYYLLLQQMK